MSLFHSQTIFNILITLTICSAIFIFFRFKLRILEISQREQAKVLQSLVMSMRNGGHQRNMVSDDEIMKHMQMQMQQGGAGAGAGVTGSQSRHSNDLIDVSDDDDDDDDEDDDDESESSSDSEDDDTNSSSSEDEKEENDENHENTTKKIIFNNGGALDTHAHTIEHLTGDDIKVIELTEPLYAVSAESKHDTNDVSDDDDDNDDDDNEDISDDDNENDDEETSDDTEVKVQELHEHASLPLQQQQQQQQQHLETSLTDTTEIKTIFKADKQQHTDYNSMNVQTLKQHLKTKLSADGLQYNETAINKLNKKELIKHLTQG